MKRFTDMLRKPEFHVFLFFIFFVLFNWPFLSIGEKEKNEVLFIYLFVVWGVVICLLFLVARCLREQDPDQSAGEK